MDIVKIDQSLLLNTDTQQGGAVVCEGIETEEQNRFAREISCPYGQGYLFFKPIPQDQVFQMICKRSILEVDV